MNLPQALRYLGRAARSLLPGSRRTPAHHAHPTYSQAELLARAEEFNGNAELHWRSIAAESSGHAHVLNKPFGTVRETPSILYRLGLVLSELDLGVGHTILDFGAGSCWLSSCLNRLRCRTISIDVSPTALQLGQELFALDPRHRMELEPRFLPYDGHRIPLPDECVDRVVCFDAFHHVPNQDEVLAEIFRVLRKGGRAVLGEPGEGHAHLDQSVYETSQSGVLENDLHIDDVVARSRRAGFDRFTLKPYPDAAILSFPYARYRDFIAGDDSLFPIQLVRDNLRQFHVISLGKGEPRKDSRNPGDLRAIIRRKDGQELRGAAGATLPLRVRVENAGDTHWIHGRDPLGGCIWLGGHLLNERHELVTHGWLRYPLPRDVAPGEAADVDATLHLPERAGRYVLRLDMVDEHVAFFEQGGSKTVDVALVVDSYVDSRAPHRFEARIQLISGAPSVAVTPGSEVRARVRLTNAGDTTWLAGAPGETGAVSLGGHLLRDDGSAVSGDWFRTPLQGTVAPLESAEIEAAFAAPPEPGRFLMRLDLVAEGVCWFEHHGSKPLDLPLETNALTPDSRWPGLLRARIELLERTDRFEARASGDIRFAVRVTNIGNTLWLHAPDSRRGHVSLGGHLLREGDAVVDQDAYRVRLPRQVAPGESLELPCDLRAPDRPGRYSIELDMVDEGIAWFAARGSKPLRVTLSIT